MAYSTSSTKLLILTILIFLTNTITAIPSRELDSMLTSLRSHHDYTLIANAIATSDLKLTLLNTPSFTLFAPTDSSVFALDASAQTTAFYYVSVLRSHFVPGHRLSANDLRRLPSSSPSSFPSLFPSQNVRVNRDEGGSDLVSVDGVDLVLPGLFYGRNVAVHGLAGILSGGSPAPSPPRRRHRGHRYRNAGGRNLPRFNPVNGTVNGTVISTPGQDNGTSSLLNSTVVVAPVSAPASDFPGYAAPSPSRNDNVSKNSSSFAASPQSFAPNAMAPSPAVGGNNANLETGMAPTRPGISAPVMSMVSLMKVQESEEKRSMIEKCALDEMAGRSYVSDGDLEYASVDL